MGEVIMIHDGKRVIDFEAFFLDDGTYVELSTTSDGKKQIASCKPKDYPDDVKRQAFELGVIDCDGNVIPMEKNNVIQFPLMIQ